MSYVLTQQEVDALAEGTEVWITWSGGNGPHLYRIVVDEHGQRRVDNPYRDALHTVGAYPLTTVRVASNTGKNP